MGLHRSQNTGWGRSCESARKLSLGSVRACVVASRGARRPQRQQVTVDDCASRELACASHAIVCCAVTSHGIPRTPTPLDRASVVVVLSLLTPPLHCAFSRCPVLRSSLSRAGPRRHALHPSRTAILPGFRIFIPYFFIPYFFINFCLEFAH